MSSEDFGPGKGRSTGLRRTSKVGRTARPVRRVLDAEGAHAADLVVPVTETVIVPSSERPVLDGVVQGLVEDALRQAAAAAEPDFVFTTETPDVARLEASSAALNDAASVPEVEVGSASTSVTFDLPAPVSEPGPAVTPPEPAVTPQVAAGARTGRRHGARSAERAGDTAPPSQAVAESAGTSPETAMQQRDRRALEAAEAAEGLETADFLMNVQRATELTEMAFNYVEVGTTRGIGTIAELPSTLPEYYIPSRQSVVVGHGAEAFARAADRLLRFHFIRESGVQFATTSPRAERDTLVEQRTNVFGVTVVTPYRIIAVDTSPTRVSFLMGTLMTHPERGEERYSVYLNEADEVVFEIFSFTATQSFVAKLGKGVARSVQSRMAARYLESAISALAG
ncbi:DUF1990 family protein [Micrococcales bacterium 31B]|nr:DUF1990 family protein [Micrococcales bacterium 31B]